MIKQIQRFIVGKTNLLQEGGMIVASTLWYSICQIKSYVHPTHNQRSVGEGPYVVQFAYQKAKIGFDNYSIRAIIRGEHIMNGYKSRH